MIDRKIIEELEQQIKQMLAPNGKWDTKLLNPGFSGAQIIKLELIQKGHAASIDSGIYVLKICEENASGSAPEPARFAMAKSISVQSDPDFFNHHVPEFIRTIPIEKQGRKYYAMLMSVAGKSFDLYQPSSGPENRFFKMAAHTIIEKTAAALTLPEPEIEPIFPHQYIEHWTTYRLQESHAPELHKFIQEITGGDVPLLFIFRGEAIVNPLKFYSFLKINQTDERCRRPLKGILHGDLHGDNIFIHNASPDIEPFQLIDFGLSREGYIGFDQAYLELSQCIYNMRDYDQILLLSIIKSLDTADDKHPLMSNARGEWLCRCLIQMRSGWKSYVTKYHSTRIDDLSRQALLARVAAGINWINKPISKNEKIIALVYSAWAARHYLESRESSLWKLAITGASEADISAQHPDPKSTDLWKLFRSEVNNFSNSEFCYVLVSGAQKYNSHLQAYGNIPWSAVIDLDPYSDQSGLLKAADLLFVLEEVCMC